MKKRKYKLPPIRVPNFGFFDEVVDKGIFSKKEWNTITDLIGCDRCKVKK